MRWLARSVVAGTKIKVWLPLLRLASTGTGLLPALSVTCPSVRASTGSLNWIVISAFIGTCVNPFAGLTAVTCGAVVLAANPVVKPMP